MQRYAKNKFFETSQEVSCVILHDVDLLPETDSNFYQCNENNESPRHLSVAIRKMKFASENDDTIPMTDKYETYYDFLIGGVLCLKPRVYELINGFSNEYFNWGGEDDGNLV